MELDRFAEVRAAIDAGRHPAEVLADVGIGEHAWRNVEEDWLTRIALAAAERDFAFTRRYNQAFTAARRRMGLRAGAVGEPRFQGDAAVHTPKRVAFPVDGPTIAPFALAPAGRAAAARAPDAVPVLPFGSNASPRGSAPAEPDAPTAPREPGQPPVGTPSEVTPAIRSEPPFSPPGGPHPARDVYPPPSEPPRRVSSSLPPPMDAAALAPSPWAPPAQSSDPDPDSVAPRTCAHPEGLEAMDALPFVGADPSRHKRESSRPPDPVGVLPFRPAGSPVAARRPPSMPPPDVDPAAETLDVNAPLESLGLPPAQKESASRSRPPGARTVMMAPVLPGATPNEASGEGESPAGAGRMGTMLMPAFPIPDKGGTVVAPGGLGGSALPFESSDRADPPICAEREVGGATIAGSPSGAPALPFASPTRLTLEQLASISAELTCGGSAADVLRRYTVDESVFIAERAAWERRFEAEPPLRGRFLELCSTYVDYIRRRNG